MVSSKGKIWMDTPPNQMRSVQTACCMEPSDKLMMVTILLGDDTAFLKNTDTNYADYWSSPTLGDGYKKLLTLGWILFSHTQEGGGWWKEERGGLNTRGKSPVCPILEIKL